MNYCFKQELHKLLWFNDNDKDNILFSSGHATSGSTTFGTSEFVPVADYSVSGHSAHNLVLLNQSGPGPSESHLLHLVFLHLVLLHLLVFHLVLLNLVLWNLVLFHLVHNNFHPNLFISNSYSCRCSILKLSFSILTAKYLICLQHFYKQKNKQYK